MNSKSLIILTGHRKSGTSLLHRLFDGVESLNCYPVDISIFYAYFPIFTENYAYSDEQLKQRLFLVVRRSMEYLRKHNPDAVDVEYFIKLLQHEIFNINLRSRQDVLDAIQRSWLEYSGSSSINKPFLFKETSQSIYFQKFQNIYPQVKMVSIIRDPRDNFAAISDGVTDYYSKMGEGIFESLSSLINRCRMDMISAAINMEKHPRSYLAIRFEDLVSKPEHTMRKVSKFLDIEFSEGMLAPTVYGKSYHGNSYDTEPILGLSSKKVGAWRQRITGSSAQIIEFWMENEMKKWGYEIVYSKVKSSCAFNEFYERYNQKYFFSDSFSIEDK